MGNYDDGRLVLDDSASCVESIIILLLSGLSHRREFCWSVGLLRKTRSCFGRGDVLREMLL